MINPGMSSLPSECLACKVPLSSDSVLRSMMQGRGEGFAISAHITK